jgi:hypothetical protein
VTDEQLNSPDETGPAAEAWTPAETTPDEPTADALATGAPAESVQYGVGPFSLREVVLAGVWLVAFIVSFFSTSDYVFSSVWTRGIDWILTIGVPTVAVFLLILRRLSPSGIRRVGSLGIDQFASVAFSVAAVIWLGQLWSQIAVAIAGGPWVVTWVVWVEFILMLAGVVLTVFAALIPGAAEDFRGREETVAHRVARGARPVTTRPRPVRPAVAQTTPSDDAAPTPAEPTAAEPATEIFTTTAASAPAQQAFWALVPEERDVVDEAGTPLFRIGPTAWALVIEDRGASFVVRHEDGRIGYLHDVSGVTRG